MTLEVFMYCLVGKCFGLVDINTEHKYISISADIGGGGVGSGGGDIVYQIIRIRDTEKRNLSKLNIAVFIKNALKT